MKYIYISKWKSIFLTFLWHKYFLFKLDLPDHARSSSREALAWIQPFLNVLTPKSITLSLSLLLPLHHQKCPSKRSLTHHTSISKTLISGDSLHLQPHSVIVQTLASATRLLRRFCAFLRLQMIAGIV